MPDYASYRIKVTTVTPLHIGSGRDLLGEYDFAVFRDQTWRINEAVLLDAQSLDDPKMADQLARTPPARLLQVPDYKPDNPCFRYVITGAPRAQGEGAQVREQLKDIYDRPYLPGSSLKGALRTALGWQLWADRGLRPEARRLGRDRRWAAGDYEHELFGPNPNKDLLRALQVSDSAAVGTDRLMLANARVVGRGGHLGSPIELEAIRPDTCLELTAKIDLALFSGWARQAGLELPGEERLTHLPEVVQAHAQARLHQEEAWFRTIPGAERLAGFYSQLRNARLGSGTFLLQIGWGGGWNSKTFGTRLQADLAFMERIVNDYRLARGARRSGDPFPKSRRVGVSTSRGVRGPTQERPASPFGWVLVEMKQR